MEGGRSVMEGGSVMEGERNRAEGGRNVVERKKECHGWRERNMMEKKRYDGGKERSRKKEKGMREGTRKKAPGGRTRREGQERGPRGVQEEEWRENKVSEGGKEGGGRGRRGVVEWRAWWRGRQRQGKPLGVHGTPKPPPLPSPPSPLQIKKRLVRAQVAIAHFLLHHCIVFAASPIGRRQDAPVQPRCLNSHRFSTLFAGLEYLDRLSQSCETGQRWSRAFIKSRVREELSRPPVTLRTPTK